MRLSTLRMAWRNLGRNRRRTGLALASIAVGQIALLAMAGLMNDYTEKIVDVITGPLMGDVQMHVPEWRDERAMDMAIPDLASRLAEIQRDPAVKTAFARIYAPALAAPAEKAYVVVVTGVDPDAETREGGLIEGVAAKPGEGRVLFGRNAADRLGLKAGDEVVVVGQGADGIPADRRYVVAGIVTSSVDLVNRQGLIMSLSDAQAMFSLADQAHELVVRAKTREEADALAARLAASPRFKDLEILPWYEVVKGMKRMVDMMDYSVLFVLIFVFVAAVAGVANTMLMSTFERVREFGMLLALGSRPWRIVGMIFAEAAALGLLGAVVGTILGCALVGVTSWTGIDMAAWGGEAAKDFSFQGMRLPLLVYPWLKLSDVLVGVGAVTATSILSAVWPAAIAARLEPVEALRK